MEISVLGHKMRLEIVVLSMVVGIFIGVNAFCSCAGGIKEGFQAGTMLVGSALSYSMGDGVKGSWESNETDTASGNPYQHLESNTGGPVPLPENQLFMFDQNKFTPECCPSTYSSSTGCVCASPEQMNYLNQRGGNRTLSTIF